MMLTTKRLPAVFLAAAFAMTTGLAAPAAASALTLEHAVSNSGSLHEHWTPERMRAAAGVHGAILIGSAPGENEGDARDELGAPWTGSGDIAKTAGRVFFTMQEDGETVPSSCSGNVVDSANGSVVMTAAHCTKGEDYVFVPAYDDGAAPFGMWPVVDMFASQIPLPSMDFAALVVDELDGRTIQDVVGAQDIAFNSPTPERLDVFGFPRERINTPDDPYSGKQLIHSTGATRIQDTWGLIGTGSDMGRGVSGGALLADFDPTTGRGTQVAAVSGTACVEVGDDGECTVQEQSAYGAPFNDMARSLYEQASAL